MAKYQRFNEKVRLFKRITWNLGSDADWSFNYYAGKTTSDQEVITKQRKF